MGDARVTLEDGSSSIDSSAASISTSRRHSSSLCCALLSTVQDRQIAHAAEERNDLVDHSARVDGERLAARAGSGAEHRELERDDAAGRERQPVAVVRRLHVERRRASRGHDREGS